MDASSRISTALARYFDSLVEELEDVITRHGYARTIGGIATLFGAAGIIGQVAGVTWLRIVTALALLAVFVTLLAATLSINKSLKRELSKTEAILHGYIEDTHTNKPTMISEWNQEIQIGQDGSAEIVRSLTIDSAHKGEQKYLFFALAYYGSRNLTRQQRRLVHFDVWRSRSGDSGPGTRADFTATWTAPRPGVDKHSAYVHLGSDIQPGDKVTAKWVWPRYSADLMTGKASEDFDVVFHKAIKKFNYRIVFKLGSRSRRVSVRNKNAPNLIRSESQYLTVVEFSEENPQVDLKLGCVVDVL